EYHSGEPQPGQDESKEVERPHLVLANIFNEHRDQDYSDNSDRDVDEENPSPGIVSHDKPADGRSDYRAHHRRHREPRHRLDQIGFRNGLQHDQASYRHHHRAPEALDDAGHDELRE